MTAFKDHFSRQAAIYAESRPHYPEELFAWVASQCVVHELAWDCATGNGQAATSLVRYFNEVIATDASEAQIANAVPHSRISYRAAKAEESGLPDRSIDCITVATALHWFDFDAFYKEAKRVLKPNALLAAWAYGWQHISPEVDAVIHYYGLELLKDYWPPERRHIDNAYADIPFPFQLLSAPAFYCRENWTLAQYTHYLLSWSGTQGYIKAHSINPISLIEKDLVAAWGDPVEKKEVVWDVVMQAGRAS